MKTVLVVDAQGGGLGRQLVAGIREALPDVRVLAVGTNTTATSAMLRAGAHEAATGENAVRVACRRADVIVGPLGIVIADAMLGEITPAMACAIGGSDAMRVLVPFSNCNTSVVGCAGMGVSAMIAEAVRQVGELAVGRAADTETRHVSSE